MGRVKFDGVVNTQFNYEIDPGVDFRVKNKKGELVFDPGLASQADRDACDINKILERYQLTGSLPDLIRQDPQYGDFSEVQDFHAAMDTVIKAQEQFAALSVEVRKRFDNDPAKMLEYVASAASDVEKQRELVKLGLALERPLPPPPGRPIAPEGGVKESSVSASPLAEKGPSA